MYVPVDWQGALSSFDAAVSSQYNFLINSIPLKACPSKVSILKASNVCAVNVPLTLAECNSRVSDILRQIKACADAEGKAFNYAVGLTNVDICGDEKGFTIMHGTVIGEAPYPMVTTHELGHEWGLNDEYVDACRCGYYVNPSTNCLDAGTGGSDPYTGYTSAACAGGSTCPGYFITCQGNKNAAGGRCIMSYALAPEPRGFCQHCLDHLNTIAALKC